MLNSKAYLYSGIVFACLMGCDGTTSIDKQTLSEDPQEATSVLKEIDEQRVEALLSKMSLEDKVTLVSGMGLNNASLGSQGDFDRVPGTAGYTHAIKSIELQSLALADGPAGLRIWPTREGDDNTYYATAFPVATLVASTWDTHLVETVGKAMGNEVKEYGVDVLLAPGMNIHRNPLNGRNFEYYSEDPLLSGTMAAAMVNGVESNGVGATIKHYIANNQETNRLDLDNVMSERAQREIYLKGFQIALEKANPWAVMSAYNGVNGMPASENGNLLTQVLRDEWGYKGVVMTDWFAGKDPVKQLKAGNDLLMPGMPERTEQIKAALNTGDLSEAELDVNVRRILGMALKSPVQHGYQYSDKPDLASHAKVARAVAAEGVVLLKNENNALPLSSSVKTVGAFGVGAYAFIAGGTGSGDVNKAYTVSLVEGLHNANLQTDQALGDRYQAFRKVESAKLPEKKLFFFPDTPLPEMPIDNQLLRDVVSRTDVGLITLGRSSGEFIDRKKEGDLYLTDQEQLMIKSVADAYHAAGKKVIMILNIGNVVEMASWQDSVDAIILPWQGGQEAGNALTDVLTGKVNPSGKLPTTFPLDYTDVPSSSSKQFPGIEDTAADPVMLLGINWGYPAKVWYEDDIYVGYRYYDTFGVDVAYPFGFGLSYTQFTVSNALKSDSISPSKTLSLPVKVTNTGKRAGKQVVQLYVSAPKGRLIKPAKELRAFAKTVDIPANGSDIVNLTVDLDDLASFDSTRNAWLLEKGEYQLHIATSVSDIAYTISMSLPDEKVVEEVSTELGPVESLNTLRSTLK